VTSGSDSPEAENVPKHPPKKGKPPNSKRVGREMAMQFLYQYDLGGKDATDPRELDLFWRKIESGDPALLDASYRKSRKYADRLIRGIIENFATIDEILGTFSEKWNLSRMGAVDRNILRVAVFEMMHCPDIPPIVSINEAVEISKDFATDKSSAFVNGVLNGIKDYIARTEKKGEGVADK
jgi:N utilization substance protein B